MRKVMDVVVQMDNREKMVIKEATNYGIDANTGVAYVEKNGRKQFFALPHLVYIGTEYDIENK